MWFRLCFHESKYRVTVEKFQTVEVAPTSAIIGKHEHGMRSVERSMTVNSVLARPIAALIFQRSVVSYCGQWYSWTELDRAV